MNQAGWSRVLNLVVVIATACLNLFRSKSNESHRSDSH
jgi:hypothetical protein